MPHPVKYPVELRQRVIDLRLKAVAPRVIAKEVGLDGQVVRSMIGGARVNHGVEFPPLHQVNRNFTGPRD